MPKLRKPRELWTAENNTKLIKYWGSATTEELLKMFSNHNMTQLSSQARHLRDRGFDLPHRSNSPKNSPNPWTDIARGHQIIEAEIQQIRADYAAKSNL